MAAPCRWRRASSSTSGERGERLSRMGVIISLRRAIRSAGIDRSRERRVGPQLAHRLLHAALGQMKGVDEIVRIIVDRRPRQIEQRDAKARKPGSGGLALEVAPGAGASMIGLVVLQQVDAG